MRIQSIILAWLVCGVSAANVCAAPLLAPPPAGLPITDVQFAPPDEAPPMLHGFKGMREQRPGYRFRDGWWFPPAAFAMEAPPIDDEPGSPPPPPRHIAWCSKHYRSYDPDTNTYVSASRGRIECISPYS